MGQVIKPGQALYRVDGAPVILMDGTTPAYRDLNSSDSDGQDILELNRNLVALGFNPDGIVVDDVWQAATTAGVELYQESLGETETGSLALGKVVFLPGAQLISTVDATVGSNGSGGSNPSGSSASYEPGAAPAPEFVDLTTPTAPTTTTPTTPKKHHKPHQNQSAQTIATLKALLKAATAQLQAETAQLRAAAHNGSGNNGGSPNSGNSGKSPSSSGSGNNNSGNGTGTRGTDNGELGELEQLGQPGASSATAILATTSTQLVVTVDLDATKQSEAKVGERVTVELPNGNTVNGKVTAVSSVAQSSSNNGNGNNGNGNNGNGNGNNGNGSSGSTIPVTVGLSGHQAGAGLDQAAVSVNFAEAKATGVLSVPVTALLATAGGGYAVQAAAEPHTLIPVTTGLFAAGYVEISGRGIHPGLAVTDSQG